MANRVTQDVVEILLQPTNQHARVTQQVIELVLSANAVLSPGSGSNSALWLPSLEQEGNGHAGGRNLLISLNTNQSVPNDGQWKECRALSSMSPCTFPNFISFGGYFKWDFDTALPPGVQILQRIGLYFYDANFNFVPGPSNGVAEYFTDYGGGIIQGTSGVWRQMAPRIVAVPSGAAYVQLECAAFINVATNAAVFTTSTHRYADLRWDDMYMIQQTDPSNAIQPKGSLPPNWTSPFSYSSTTTSITWSWAGTSIFRADGTTQAIAAGSIVVSGLTANTTYYFFPYWDEILQGVYWVVATHGTAPNKYAFLAAELDLTQQQQQNLLSRVGLSPTAMSAATTAAGTGGGTGVGGSGRCNRVGTKVRTKTRGIQKLEDCVVGEWILGRQGWTQITSLEIMPATCFIRFELESGDAIEVTPTHPFTIPSTDGDIERRAMQFTMSDALYTTTGISYPSVIKVIRLEDCDEVKSVPENRAACVSISCTPEMEFYAGEDEPNILSHNMIAVT